MLQQVCALEKYRVLGEGAGHANAVPLEADVKPLRLRRGERRGSRCHRSQDELFTRGRRE